MGNILTTFKTRLKASSELVSPEIKTVLVDYLSSVNENHEYPLLIATPPTSVAKGSTMEYEELNCEIWVYIPEHLRNGLDWLVICDECKASLRKVIMELFNYRPDYILLGDVAWTNGHFMHNAMLAGSKASFKMRAFYGC